MIDTYLGLHPYYMTVWFWGTSALSVLIGIRVFKLKERWERK